jgi:predicted metalloprotease
MTKLPSKTLKTGRSGWSFAKRGAATLLAVATTSVVALSGVQGATAGPPVPGGTETSTTPSALKMVPASSTTTAGTADYNTVRYNALYRTGKLGASQCRAPQYPLTTAGNVKAWHLSFLYCLNNVWVHKIRATGKTFSKPTLVLHQSGVQSACGWIPTGNAYYCSASKGIYIDWPRYVKMYNQNGLYARAYAAQIIAHEYGHHVQSMVGILQASAYRMRYVWTTTAKKLEENRRMELQASCFSAAYLGADKPWYPMTGSFYNMWHWLVFHMGDDAVAGGPRDHGSMASHGWWSDRGFNTQSAYGCNTWAAASSIVD